MGARLSAVCSSPGETNRAPLEARRKGVVQETGEGATMKKGPKGGDEFSGLKSQLAREVREIRTALKERDELLQKGASGSKQTVQLSHQIRTQIKGAKEDAQKLLALQKKEAAKKDKKGTNATQVEERQEVVELVFKHIEECEAIEKRRYNGKQAEARVELFSGGTSGAGSSSTSSTVSRVPVGTELPDIETQDGLKMLAAKDKVIDEGLDQIAEGVQDLKSLALDMRDEVKVQSAMVDEITSKVDSASSQLSGINKKMKKTLQSTRSADRFILDFILLAIVLGIAGYVVSMFM